MMTIFALLSILLATQLAANAAVRRAEPPDREPSPARSRPTRSSRAARCAERVFSSRCACCSFATSAWSASARRSCGRLPAALWPEEPSPARGTPDAAAAAARCDGILQF